MKQTVQIEKVSNGYVLQCGTAKLIASSAQGVADKMAEAICSCIKPDKHAVGDLFYVALEFEELNEHKTETLSNGEMSQ